METLRRARDVDSAATPRKLTRVIVISLAALATATAVFFLTHALRPRLPIADPDDEMAIGPDWHKPAHPWSRVEAARRSKIDGLEACGHEQWKECYNLLLMARADDPTLEKDPAVVLGCTTS